MSSTSIRPTLLRQTTQCAVCGENPTVTQLIDYEGFCSPMETGEVLAAQLAHTGEADVIATNAVTSGGSVYFPAAAALRRPARSEILMANPIIQSSAMVRTCWR